MLKIIIIVFGIQNIINNKYNNNEDLLQYDVIVPIWSSGIKGDFCLSQLLEAVEKGVGLATFHGGINWCAKSI